jgi:hypothetical protein
MRITISYRDKVTIPSRGTIDTLVRLTKLRPPVSLQDVVGVTGTENKAKAFLVNASRSGIIIRGSWDTYYPVPPHAAMWSSLLMDYYRDLCRMHGALNVARIPHSFGCITASRMADYVPGIPIVAVPMEHFDDLERADVYGITATAEEFKRWSDNLGFKWPDGAFIMNVPTLPWDWTALLLGTIGQPREISAANEILSGRDVNEPMARYLNSVGLVTRREVIEKEIGVREPKHVVELRRRYAESLRQLNIMRGWRDEGPV